MPLHPGDWPHFLLNSIDHIAVNGPDGAYLIRRSLDESPHRVTDARYLVPGENPALVWAVTPVGTITAIAMDNGCVAPSVTLDETTTWVLGAVDGGFVVYARSGVNQSEQRYWSPHAGFAELPKPVPGQSTVVATAGSAVFIVSPPNTVSTVDLRTGARHDVAIEVGRGLIVDVCPSRDMEHLAVVSSTGVAVIANVVTGTTIAELKVGSELDTVGWTSPLQLVTVTGDAVVAFNVADGSRHRVAGLTPSTRWRLAAANSRC